MAPDLYSLTRKLIDIPSVSGSEGKVGDYLFELLWKDYEVERQLIAPERFNIIATAGEAPSVFLSTHMDTVPPYIESSEDDAYIYGRGACDAKGIIAAQIIAALRLREEGLTGIGMLFTVDEELGSLGARAAN